MVESRRFRYSVAVLTAFALAGCWGGTPATPPAPSAEAPAETPAVTPTNDGFSTLQGTVALRGMPWANAKLQVVDAVTGKPAGSAGTTLRAEGAMQTDATGNFSIRVAGLAPGKVARVIATLDSGTLTALVGDGGQMAAAYKVQAAEFPLKISEISLCLDQVASGVLKMAGGLKSEAAAALIKKVLEDLLAMAPKIEEAFKQDDMLAISLSLTADAVTGLVPDSLTVSKVLDKVGLSDSVTFAIKGATTTIAQLAQDKLNVTNAAALDNVNFIGTSLKITVEGGVFKVTDPKTGESITVNLSGTTTGSTTTTTNNNSGGGGSSNTPSVAFNPVATFDTNTTTIRLKVTQAAGESDIASIVVRVPVVQALLAVQVANLDLNNPAGSITAAGGQIKVGGVTTAFEAKDDAINPELGPVAMSTGMPSSFAGTSLNYGQGIQKDGYLVIPSLTSKPFGQVRVFTNEPATTKWWQATNIYVAAKYVNQAEFHNATSLKTARGHETYLDFTLPAGVTFPQGAVPVIEVLVTPRDGGAAARTVTATHATSLL